MHVDHLAIAALLALTALAHSVLGEVLVFRLLRHGGIVPRASAPPLRSRHLEILWASWHVVSVLGLVFAAIELRRGLGHELDPAWLTTAMATGCLISSGLVLVGTRGRHPGWLALAAAALLLWRTSP